MHKIALPQAAIDRVLKRRKSLHVFNDIDPARTALVVIDMQVGLFDHHTLPDGGQQRVFAEQFAGPGHQRTQHVKRARAERHGLAIV